MFFTQEDYRKIVEYLRLNSYKDTDLPPIGEMDLLDEDIITIVHNGINYKVFLRKLIAAIGSSEDTVKTVHSINVSFITDEGEILTRFVKYSTTLEAIDAVPAKYRFPGIGVTWIDTNNVWKTYLFKGTSAEQWDDLSQFIPYNLANEIHENEGLNPEDPEYTVDSSEVGVTQRLLQEKIRDIKSVCSSLNDNYTTLSSDYSTLSEGYSTLNTNYTTLSSNYNTLATNYDTLNNTCLSLLEQINAINIDKATVSLSVSPAVVFVGSTYTVNVTASSNIEASSITIKHNNVDLQTGSGTSLAVSDTVEATTSGTESYSASFIINNITKTASKTLTKVNKIYYGVGTENSYSGISTYLSVRTNANGTYGFNTTSESRYAYILVPYAMSAINLNNVKLDSGFGYNLLVITDNATIDNVRYRVYRSAENAAGENFNVVIS